MTGQQVPNTLPAMAFCGTVALYFVQPEVDFQEKVYHPEPPLTPSYTDLAVTYTCLVTTLNLPFNHCSPSYTRD